MLAGENVPVLHGSIGRGGICSDKPLCGVVRPVYCLVCLRGSLADDLGVNRLGPYVHLT